MRSDLRPSAQPPEYLDQSLPHRAQAFLERLHIRRASTDLCMCDVAIVWDQTRARDPALTVARRVVVLDPAMLHEGDLWIELVAELRPIGTQQREAFRALLLKHCVAKRSECVHVLGTGPSLANVDPKRLPGGASIFCNSLVRNTRFLAALRPAVITAVDPIFHAGASRHAQAFREGLIAALRRCEDALFVCQERDATLYAGILPEDSRGRLAPLPVRYSMAANFHLEERFWVTATRNVLTLTMLPLASLLGCEIRIYGCDGRPIRDANHFWNYDPSTVYSQELAWQRAAHPGFYTLSYEEYYALHCETVRRWLRDLERRGYTVRAETPSHIPALATRAGPGANASRFDPLFTLRGQVAYARRALQSIYGATLEAKEVPGSAKTLLRGTVRAARALTGTKRVPNDTSKDPNRRVGER